MCIKYPIHIIYTLQYKFDIINPYETHVHSTSRGRLFSAYHGRALWLCRSAAELARGVWALGGGSGGINRRLRRVLLRQILGFCVKWCDLVPVWMRWSSWSWWSDDQILQVVSEEKALVLRPSPERLCCSQPHHHFKAQLYKRCHGVSWHFLEAKEESDSPLVLRNQRWQGRRSPVRGGQVFKHILIMTHGSWLPTVQSTSININQHQSTSINTSSWTLSRLIPGIQGYQFASGPSIVRVGPLSPGQKPSRPWGLYISRRSWVGH